MQQEPADNSDPPQKRPKVDVAKVENKEMDVLEAYRSVVDATYKAFLKALKKNLDMGTVDAVLFLQSLCGKRKVQTKMFDIAIEMCSPTAAEKSESDEAEDDEEEEDDDEEDEEEEDEEEDE